MIIMMITMSLPCNQITCYRFKCIQSDERYFWTFNLSTHTVRTTRTFLKLEVVCLITLLVNQQVASDRLYNVQCTSFIQNCTCSSVDCMYLGIHVHCTLCSAYCVYYNIQVYQVLTKSTISVFTKRYPNWPVNYSTTNLSRRML